MPQSAVADKMAVGIVGQVATLQGSLNATIDTGTSEESTTGISPGRFVVQGTADDGCKLPTATSDKLKGVALFSHEYERTVELDADLNFKPGTTMGLLVTGPVYVAPTSDVAPGDEVHVYTENITGTGTTENPQFHAGDVDKAGSAGKSLDISAFAQWKTTAAAAGDVCILFVDLTNVALASAD